MADFHCASLHETRKHTTYFLDISYSEILSKSDKKCKNYGEIFM